MVDTLTEKFDQLAPDYDRATRFVEWLFLRRLRRALLKDATGTVLEIGVGTGYNFEHYADDVTLFGIDISEAMIEEAHFRAEDSGREVFLNIMDAGELAFPDATFDTVISTLTLCSMPNIKHTISEMLRVCKPDGKILFIEHGRSRFKFINYWLDRGADKHWDEYGCHQNLDMEKILRQSSLNIERIESHLFGIVKVFRARP